MITDRNKYNCVTICCCICFLAGGWAASVNVNANANSNANAKDEGNAVTESATVRDFSPRVDYNSNEWKPVGRGDPLKNDPTYDYSPPTLDRVRYWAESNDAKNATKDGKRKDSEIGSNVSLLRKSNYHDRLRGNAGNVDYPSASHLMKNAKGETPLLQPKYTAIRRSYYAQQLPTHLMPPPMHNVAVPGQMMKTSVSMDYRHGMPSYMAGSPSMYSSPASSSSSSKPHYTSSSTSSSAMTTTSHAPWSSPMHSSSPMMMHHSTHRVPASTHYDPHYDSVHYFSYTQPDTTYTASPSTSYSSHASHSSPNSIRTHQNAVKQSNAPRKPWLHELLQKEVIKTTKTPATVTQYFIGPTKSVFYESHPGAGISTTYAPVTFMSNTTPTTTTRPATFFSSSPKPFASSSFIAAETRPGSTIYITAPTPTITSAPVRFPSSSNTQTSTTALPITSSTTTTTTTMTPNRLLIPNTSNLPNRPTVAPPLELTTDSLFKHYNQPSKPLRGPMYMIIEGHSKVKKYGKNEIDLHQPKIVPVISKREPIVRVADPNDRYRGTPETFQVKHLHTKTTPPIKTTTTTTSTTTTTTTTTTAKPPTKEINNKKATLLKESKTATTTTATTKPTTTKPKVSTASEKVNQPPPTGMQGLLSLIGDFLGEAPSDVIDKETNYVTTQSTILKPVPSASTTSKEQQQLSLEARISSKGSSISAESEETVGGVTTELPLEQRQVFDYDQLPEKRIKQFIIGSLEDVDSAADDWVAYDDDDDEVEADVSDSKKKQTNKKTNNDEYEDDITDQGYKLIKRIDKLVGNVKSAKEDADVLDEVVNDDGDDAEEEDIDLADVNLEDYDDDSIELRRLQPKKIA